MRLQCIAWDCGSPVVKVSDHDRHVMSSSSVPLKTHRVRERCPLNLSRAQTSFLSCDVVVRRGGCQLRCRPRHLTMVQNYELSDRHPIHLQWVPSHVDLLGNEVANDLAKAATSNPVDPENHMVHTSTEIYSRAKELICRTWAVPPVHP
ncbi:uncharacterized protein TNCV_1257151 [Trichonephila clavipes]|nr:uncharacterized protein TNCV_1257151 [Trichonephila clavipes]